jgi:exopolysaccharide biosynthesis polyprenyl glycosylphosphotransferase
MFQRFSPRFSLFLFGSDMLLTMLAVVIAYCLRLILPFHRTILDPGLWRWSEVLALFPLIVVIWSTTLILASVYDSHRNFRIIDELQTIAFAVFLANSVLACVLYLTFREVSRYLFIYFCTVDLILLVALRLLVRTGFRFTGRTHAHTGRQVLIIGAGQVGRRVERLLESHRLSGICVLGFLDDDPAKQGPHHQGAAVMGTLDDVWAVVNQYKVDEIIVALPLRAHQRLIDLVSAMTKLPVRIYVVPDLFDLAFHIKIDQFSGIPMIGLREPAIDGFQRLTKRAFDMVLATFALVVAAPIMAIIAIAIKIDSPGPVIFKQERVGENGRIFRMYKFRSMYQDAERHQAEVDTYTADHKVIHKHAHDPRVTRVGHFVRTTSLDELPQLVNILKGEMSLVGPRPEMPCLVKEYESWQHKRFAVPQGLTGWWQVNGRSDKPMQYYTTEDLYYIQNYSLWLDIKIMWRTVSVLVTRKGAY